MLHRVALHAPEKDKRVTSARVDAPGSSIPRRRCEGTHTKAMARLMSSSTKHVRHAQLLPRLWCRGLLCGHLWHSSDPPTGEHLRLARWLCDLSRVRSLRCGMADRRGRSPERRGDRKFENERAPRDSGPAYGHREHRPSARDDWHGGRGGGWHGDRGGAGRHFRDAPPIHRDRFDDDRFRGPRYEPQQRRFRDAGGERDSSWSHDRPRGARATRLSELVTSLSSTSETGCRS